MKITITIKNEWSGKSYDISLDNQQKIATTMKVLRENLPEALEGIGMNPQLQSERTSRHLNMGLTYEEAHVFTGDSIFVYAEEKE